MLCTDCTFILNEKEKHNIYYKIQKYIYNNIKIIRKQEAVVFLVLSLAPPVSVYVNIFITLHPARSNRKLIYTELNALNRFVGWCWCIKTKTTLILTEMFYIQHGLPLHLLRANTTTDY